MIHKIVIPFCGGKPVVSSIFSIFGGGKQLYQHSALQFCPVACMLFQLPLSRHKYITY